jgi:hypothetical protein
MRLALTIGLILCLATAAHAERYALVGLDDVVVTVIESDGFPASAVPPTGGYVVIAPAGSGAESGGSYKDGVFSPRPKSPQDILVERMTLAIDLNRIFLAAQSPSQEQTNEQVKRLTQQITAILQYQLQRFEGVVQ